MTRLLPTKLILGILFVVSTTVSADTWYNEEDLYFMTEAIYFEARSEPLDCQVAVGYTIMNRVKKRKLTIKQVVWQRKQFSYTHDGKSEKMFEVKALQIAKFIAILVLEGDATDLTEGGEYYHNYKIVDWKFKSSYTNTIRCGSHQFMK